MKCRSKLLSYFYFYKVPNQILNYYVIIIMYFNTSRVNTIERYLFVFLYCNTYCNRHNILLLLLLQCYTTVEQ